MDARRKKDEGQRAHTPRNMAVKFLLVAKCESLVN